ncbi:MAG: SIS domain-containing protein [Streptosporangiales bacterium]|nr:SIS domain-containing protein [Streptosporangiales bacterium]
MPTELQRMIHAQPSVLEQLAGTTVEAEAGTLRGASRVMIVGTGTSFHAAELGAYLFRSGGTDAIAVPAAEAARWYPRPRSGAAYVIISHTGETAYALSLRAAAREAGLPLVTITGPASGWDEAIKTPEKETSETYTVSYLAALAILGLLAHHVAGTPTGAGELLRTATAVRDAIADPGISGIAVPPRALAIVGAGPWGVSAREGALKIRESARILAEGFDPERLLHGAAVPYAGEDALIALQPGSDRDGLTGQLLEAARKEGITTHRLDDQHDDLHPYLRQLPVTARLQMLASQFTGVTGTNPDVAITGAWTSDQLWESGGPTAGGR